MFGIVVQLALSWIIVWLVQKRNLSVLGFSPTKKRLIGFLLFFIISVACCALGFLMKQYLGNQDWKLNPALSASLVLEGIRWNIISVLFEELIFRGVLLYILIKRLGATKAIIISAVGFGIYHWFSFGVIGNPMGMAIAFISTGLMGLVLGYAYAKTFSLYIPIAIHFGWNLTQIFIFSQGPIGNGVFVPVVDAPFRTGSYLLFYTATFLPVILVLVIDYLLLRRMRQETDRKS
jgi:membrane protease YdiL (CAAX protease family)